MSDWNDKVIAEFRANEGNVGGNFDGAPMVLLHHRGRKSGTQYVAPLMYLPDETDHDLIYIFASAAGAAQDPLWHGNVVAAATTDVEVGAETFPVSVTEVSGDERDRVYAAQVGNYPFFGEYAKKTEGIRTIPVLALRRQR